MKQILIAVFAGFAGWLLCAGAPASSYEAGAPPAFGPCPDAGRHAELDASVCTFALAPLDPARAHGEMIELFVRKFPAPGERIGEFWMLAGGPGESGASFYTRITQFQTRFPGYDVFIPDHRGAGRSARLCEGETVGSEAGTRLTAEEFGPCFREIWENAERTRQFSMTHAAHDLDLLIRQLGGSGRRFVYAVSYGTGLALRFGQLHEQRVDGLILDSLVPSLHDTQHDLSRRSYTVDQVGRRVLAECAADRACDARFEGGVEAAYAQLLAAIAAGERDDIAHAVPGGNLKNALGSMLDIPEARDLIPDVIHMSLYEPERLAGFYEEQVMAAFSVVSDILDYEASAFSITLAGLIGLSETNRRPDQTAEDVAAEEAGLWFTSPLTLIQTYTSMPAYERDAWFDAPHDGLPPVLVVHGSLDPKTPLEGARAHVDALEADGADVTLMTVERAPHAIWFFAPACLYRAMDDFLSGAPGATTCTPDEIR